MNHNNRFLQIDAFQQTLEASFAFRWDGHSVVEFRGKESLDLLHRLSTNDLVRAPQGGTVGTCFLTEKGRLIDVVYVMNLGEKVIALTSPGASSQFAAWIERFIIMEEVTIRDCSDEITIYSVIGPSAEGIVVRVFGMAPPAWGHAQVAFGGEPILISRRGPPEQDRFDILFPTGAEQLLTPVLTNLPRHSGETAELLRIWRGVPAHGREISERHNPYEVGLTDFLSSSKGCYVGQEVIARLDTYDKVQHFLGGLLLARPPAGDEPALYMRGHTVGRLTSCSSIAVADQFPALAILNRKLVKVGDRVSLSPDGLSESIVLPIPFAIDSLMEPTGNTSGGGGGET